MPNIINEGILPVLLKPGLNVSQWEFGYYKLQAINEAFAIEKVVNWQNNQVFSGIDDGYYYVVARMKLRHNVFDYRKEQINCNAGTCVLQILAVTKTPSISSCSLSIQQVTKNASGGSGEYIAFSGIALFGRNI